MRLVREVDGAVVVEELLLAVGFLTRLRGLLGRSSLAPGEGMWLEPCDSIHMMFMRFAIDVLFVARPERSRVEAGARGEVVGVYEGVRPWVGFARCPRATATVELAAGRVAALGLREGDRLVVEGGDG